MKDFAARFRPAADDSPVELTQIAADDALVESLRSAPLLDDATAKSNPDTVPSVGSIPARQPAGDTTVEQLLLAWRAEINATPLPAPMDTDIAVAIVRQAPSRRRTLRPTVAVAAAIAALLIGSAAIGARSATPESPLWSITELLWGDRADSVLAGESAREGLDAAHQALQAGHPDAAATELVRVTEVVTLVADRDGRQTLEQEIQSVRAEIEVATQTSPPSSPATSVITPATTTQLPTGSTSSTSPSAPSSSSTSVPSTSSSTSTSQSVDPVPPSTPPDTSVPETTTSSPTDTTTTTISPTTTDTSSSGEELPPGTGSDDQVPATSAELAPAP